MRETGRVFKLVGETLLGEKNAPLRYRQGCERDALDASETEERSNLMEIEAAATNKLIEAYQLVQSHQNRIKRATRTCKGTDAYAVKVAESSQRMEDRDYKELLQVFYDGRQHILVSALEQSERTARAAIEDDAPSRYSLALYDTHLQMRIDALQQKEQIARESINTVAMRRYSFFETRHQEITNLILSEQQGFAAESPTLCDEDGFDFVMKPPTAQI